MALIKLVTPRSNEEILKELKRLERGLHDIHSELFKHTYHKYMVIKDANYTRIPEIIQSRDDLSEISHYLSDLINSLELNNLNNKD